MLTERYGKIVLLLNSASSTADWRVEELRLMYLKDDGLDGVRLSKRLESFVRNTRYQRLGARARDKMEDTIVFFQAETVISQAFDKLRNKTVYKT